MSLRFSIACCLLLSTLTASALDRVEARPGETSTRGRMTGATEFQFGVFVSGTLDQKIDQLGRELRLLQFAKTSFPPLLSDVSYSGTNRTISQCLSDLSNQIGKSIPMDSGTNDFMVNEFVFEKVPLETVLKYLAAFDDSILDVSDGKLVCRPVRQALALEQPEYDLLQLMASQQFEAAKQVLAKTPVNVEKIKDQEGQTLLHFAAWHNQTVIAQQLIGLGADINAKDDVGFTPLNEAVRFGNRECAELLIEKGADLNIPDNNNNAPLKTAVFFGYPDIAKMLVQQGAKLDIFTASGLGMIEQVRKFLDHDDGITTQTGGFYRLENYGITPLFWAARGGSVEVANLLVSRGELVSTRNGLGETPLFWATDNGCLETAKFLVEHGADVNATNRNNSTPLLTAARNTVAPELIDFLLKAGADVNARDDQGENALHKLAWFGCPEENVETARMLFAAGADITAKNKDGKTPLEVLLENDFQNRDLVELYRKQAGKTLNEK